jgi:ribose transport system substrate-binding protein
MKQRFSARAGRLLAASAVVAASGLLAMASPGFAETVGNYQGVARTWLYNPVLNETVDASQYKKDGPYVIGFSNASVSNFWRVAFQHATLWAAEQHKDQIKRFIVTDALDDPTKQIADIEDLLNQGVDLLLVSPATEDALDAIVGRAMKQGVPVVLVDRNVKSPENYVSFITSSAAACGRIEAQWMAEKMGGKGNIVMLGGIPGVSVAETRIAAFKEVLANFPDIKVLDFQWTDWDQGKTKAIVSAEIQKFGDQIDGVLTDTNVTGAAVVEAYLDAGYEGKDIPLVTGGDIAQMWQQAITHGFSAAGVDYPPSMGITAVEVALKVLDGQTVPKTVLVNAPIIVTEGDDTASVKGDMTPQQFVNMNWPPDYATSNGLPPDYDPRTWVVQYPK